MEEDTLNQSEETNNTNELEPPTETTICVDTLKKLYEETPITPKTEPGADDKELEEQVNSLKTKFNTAAKGIAFKEKNILVVKYAAKRLEISASLPSKKAQFTQERFNSIDAEKYGENNIKTTFAREINKLMEGDDEYQKKLQEKQEKKAEEEEKKELTEKETAENKRNAEADKREEEQQKKLEELNSDKNTIDVNQIISEIGGAQDESINKKANELYVQLKEHLDDINQKAQSYGEIKGAEMVKQYNAEIEKQAKEQYEKNKDSLAKCEADLNADKQALILSIGAMIGL